MKAGGAARHFISVKSRWLAPVSALLTLAAFDPVNASPLVFIALAPLLLRLSDPAVRPFRCGYGFGLIFGLGQFVFVGQLTYRWTGSFWLSLVPVAAAVPLYAIYFGLAGWMIAHCWKLRQLWLIPLVWAGIEIFRSYIPVLAFPWGLLASPLWRLPWLIQFAHYGTIDGMGALVCLVNLIFAVVVREGKWQPAGRMIAAAAAGILLPLVLSFLPSGGRPMRVTAGQLGLDLAFSDRPRTDGSAVQVVNTRALVGEAVDFLQREARAQQSQLMILPEGLISAGSQFPPSLPFRVTGDPPLIFGAQRGDQPTYQSAFGFDGHWSYADKTRLVIFGEFVPRWIPFIDAFQLSAEDLSSSDRVSALTVGGVTVGPLICFEGLFADLGYRQSLNGAQILGVMSMDDWFLGTPALDQLRGGSIWRAVETGLPVVRAATTGYTLICDGHGNVMGQLRLRKREALTEQILVPGPRPVWWLPVFPFLSLLGCLLVPFLGRGKVDR